LTTAVIKEWFKDIAEVSYKGILYNGLYYSCGMAIKEQWFYKASIQGVWKIGVKICPEDLSSILLVDYKCELCRSIEYRIFTGEKLDQYFSLIEIFKQCKQKFNKQKNVK
jgi:hypothetical protein